MRDLKARITHLLFRRRHADEETGCWEWTGARNQAGYGVLHINAHRLAAILWLDLDPTDKRHVCHKCDNPCCFNPEHLYLGSMSQNAKDRAKRGRGRENSQSGRENPNSKLTESDVRDIRLLVADGYSQEEVAAAYGIRQPHVSRIVRRVVWADLPDEPGPTPSELPRRKRQLPLPYNQGEAHPSSVMTEAKVRELRALADSGIKQVELAKQFGISTAQTSNIVHRRSWTHVR